MYEGEIGEDGIPSKDLEAGMWNVVQSQAKAYSAYEPPGVPISWNAATRSPFCLSITIPSHFLLGLYLGHVP